MNNLNQVLSEAPPIAPPPLSWKARLMGISLDLIIGLLILLWIYTGLNKGLDYNETKLQMARSPFIQPIAGFIAFTVPFAEMFTACLLISKRTRLLGLFLSFLLMLTFTGYIYAMLHYSYYVPCSCGGVLSSLSWDDHFVFNIVFTALTLVGIIIHERLPVKVTLKRKDKKV